MAVRTAKLLVTESKRRSPGTSKSIANTVPEHQRSVVLRLSRVEGQVRGVLRMIADGQTTDAVAQQLAAARQALERAFFELIASDLEQEVNLARNAADRTRKVSEKIRLLVKYS